MKWIKASDRQPDTEGRFFVKACQGDMTGYLAPMVMERVVDKWVYESEDDDDLHVIEWLDESSPIPTSAEIVKRAEELYPIVNFKDYRGTDDEYSSYFARQEERRRIFTKGAAEFSGSEADDAVKPGH